MGIIIKRAIVIRKIGFNNKTSPKGPANKRSKRQPPKLNNPTKPLKRETVSSTIRLMIKIIPSNIIEIPVAI